MESRAFFLPQQLALDAARVHLNLESFPDGIGQLLRSQGSIRGLLLRNEPHHFGSQFVAALRAALVRKQAEESVLLKGCLRLIERGARKPAGVCGLADRALVDVNLAQHLVLDLDQVVGIEEAAVLKQRIGNGFRMRVESAMTPQRLAFAVGIV